ncbi:hydrolase [Actinoplanes italicus]|uniref:Histidine triad (HIT) family protein n=1 Tax=Actinoplanes italicus TaxID=113567 RepID=A0A2T0KPQ3_9ACTN|nr:HIT family protein [Actinoplanes italicus]PRX25710.1 histidine triad (HIT) family protein [Actinoplanes italicus]GIE28838.1 hydrolase [Actinoplanes italicus]
MADCVFCGIVSGSVPAFTVATSPAGIAFLDIRPVFKGHVLVIPRPHIVTLPSLPVEDVASYFEFVRLLAAAVPAALGAQGTFVAMNNVVSQSVPHLHTHVVPRTKGDGLRGFFWPRRKYDSDEEAASFADTIGKEYLRLSVEDGGRRE